MGWFSNRKKQPSPLNGESPVGQPHESILKAPAKVLACLRPGWLTVLLGYGLGMADGGVPNEVPMDLVPFDLRMPNSEFIVVIDRTKGQLLGVERKGGDGGDQGDPEGRMKVSRPVPPKNRSNFTICRGCHHGLPVRTRETSDL